MNTKLQELTDKIYQEGVEKGNSEAKVIIDNAQAEAQAIVDKANVLAVQIIKDAEEKTLELMSNTKSELRLFTQQSLNALKTEITNILSGDIVSNSVKPAIADTAFMQKLILTLVQDWTKTGNLTIQTKDAKELTDYFTANAKDLLNKGLKITEVNGKKAEFTVVSESEGYKVTFGEEEFIAYFKEFLRPKLIEMLF